MAEKLLTVPGSDGALGKGIQSVGTYGSDELIGKLKLHTHTMHMHTHTIHNAYCYCNNPISFL